MSGGKFANLAHQFMQGTAAELEFLESTPLCSLLICYFPYAYGSVANSSLCSLIYRSLCPLSPKSYSFNIMASTNDGLMPAFFVCHHDFARSFVTPETLELAEQANVSTGLVFRIPIRLWEGQYDALTVRITNNIFHSRVKDLFRKDQPYSNLSHTAAASLPVVPALSPSDTHLGPGKIVPKLLGIVSPWIDLCSLDPIIYNVSRQVLQMEVSFAAFCGLNALVLPAPRLHHGAANGHGISQYAHAIQEVLQIGLYIQFSVTLPMWDDPAHLEEPEGSLASFASLKSIGAEEKAPRASTDSRSRHDFFGTWDAWNVIRSLCNYHFRLMVGMFGVLHFFLLLLRKHNISFVHQD